MKKVQEEGQLSLWDIEIPIKEVSFTKMDEKVTVLDKKITKMDQAFTNLPPGGTVEEDILNKYMDAALKIIRTCGGRFIVYQDNGSIHFTGKGDIDFKTETHTPILPIDKILYSKHDESVNEIQKKTLERVKNQYNVKQVIKRYGDKNFIVITEEETISINPKGWILNFKGAAIFNENEVLKDRLVGVGDTVKVEYGGKEHIGKVVHIYGPGNCTLNVVFDNKHTAFYRDHVKLVC
ncbi:MAG: hypothetical protein E7F58_11215 [Clostridium saudiense]|uniref:hypothetical protein n=1 Tax=Clostridium saudiense TaxID=1414720 RepID=UPI0022093CE9|nr:hypothetical protein [Clostridium saudiense]MDU3522209.1 hypothetical protein [Clostridium saudiense]UVX78405.1 MAG: hypothetical protein [Bacteriophage sp.]